MFYTVSKDHNQHTDLVLGGIPSGRWLLLIFLIPISIGLCFLGYGIVQELQLGIPAKHLSAGLAMLGLFTFLLLFWVMILLQFLPRQLQQGRIQTVHKRKSGWNTFLGLLVFTPFVAAGVVSVYEFLFPAAAFAPDWAILQTYAKDFTGQFLMISTFSLVFFLIYLWCIVLMFQKIVQAAKHGRITGTFNKERYLLGEDIQVSVSDKQSSRTDYSYRVHLNFVQENEVTTGSGKNRRKEVVREIIQSEYQTANPLQLQQGLTFNLPASAEQSNFRTQLKLRRKPSYWEVLVEEVDGHFWVRFLVNVE